MSSSPVVPRPTVATPERAAADRAYRRAWWSLALCPVALALAFLVGEGLLSLLGGDASDPASWAVVLAAVPALLVLLAPGALAFAHSRRAHRLGRADAWVPAVVGAVVVLGFVTLNVVSWLLSLLVD